MYQFLEKGLSLYIKFLLSFALRNPEFSKSKIMNTIRRTQSIRLVNDDPNSYIEPGQDANDVELIPMQLKPLVKLHAEILVTGKTRNRKYKVVTVPELDQIHKDFFNSRIIPSTFLSKITI